MFVKSSHAPIPLYKGVIHHHTIGRPATMRPTSLESDEPSLNGVPRSLLRSMDGAKAFLHPSLLKVPWLWRLTSRPSVNEDVEQVRNYCKNVRTMLNVTSAFKFAENQVLRSIPHNR